MPAQKQAQKKDERFQRARQPDQKAVRQQQILAAARRLLKDADDLSALSLTALAREAQMAKSNIYRYFESREAVLLEVLSQEWDEWVAAALDELAGKPVAVSSIAKVMATTASARPVMCQLVSAMPSVLEHNVTVETVATFKAHALGLIASTASALYDVCPALSVASYGELLHHVIPLMVGLWPLAHPSPEVGEVLAAEEMQSFRHDFERDLERIVTLVGLGLAQTESGAVL